MVRFAWKVKREGRNNFIVDKSTPLTNRNSSWYQEFMDAAIAPSFELIIDAGKLSIDSHSINDSSSTLASLPHVPQEISTPLAKESEDSNSRNAITITPRNSKTPQLLHYGQLIWAKQGRSIYWPAQVAFLFRH